MYKLIEFTSEKEYVNLFLSLPRDVYKGDKNYKRESKKEVMAWLECIHPCAKFLVQKNCVVLKHKSPIARGIFFVNKIGNFGSVGLFACKDDCEAVTLLMDKAKEFCKENGVAKMFAPMNGSIWGDYRIMTKGFADKPYMGEPYNKPYYYDLLVKCGFKTAKKWETQFVSDIRKKEAARRIEFIANLKSSQELSIRGMQDFDQDIRILHKLIMHSFSGFFLFHEIDERTYVDLYKDMKKICDKKTMKLAFDKENRSIGFGLAFPDYNSKLRFLFKRANRYILWFFGVVQNNSAPSAFKDLVSPILQFLYEKNKGCISAMMSEDSKALSFTKEYDAVHEYVLMETDIN